MARPIPPGSVVVIGLGDPALDSGGFDDAEIARVAALVGSICDPELPPLTLDDLGILRSVDVADGRLVVRVTPTYSGCPAVEYIESEVRAVLDAAGHHDAVVERSFSPAWTTDWVTPTGRRKLAEAGIAPPRPLPTGDGTVPVTIGRRVAEPIPCPRCGSLDTEQVSPFGSTACKSLNRCRTCAEPFDHFKEI